MIFYKSHIFYCLVIVFSNIFFLQCVVANNSNNSKSLEKLKNEYYMRFQTTCVNSILSFSGTEMTGFTHDKAFGPPTGEGLNSASLDVFVIGEDQEAIFYNSTHHAVDKAGNDFKIFENAFQQTNNKLYSWDLGFVEVSINGTQWYGFEPQHDHNTSTISKKIGKSSLIGLEPVITNYIKQPIDPRLSTSGGDGFDLSDAKLITDRTSNNPLTYTYTTSLPSNAQIKYIKVVDGGSILPDNQVFSNGIDIDAICFMNFQ